MHAGWLRGAVQYHGSRKNRGLGAFPFMETTPRPTDHARVDLDRLHEDVCFGRAGGKVLWQPRILAWYSDKVFQHRPLPAPYTGMRLSELYRALGVSNRTYDYGRCFVAHEDPAVRTERRDLSPGDYEVAWHTPVGSQRAVYRRVPDSPWHEPLKWPITEEREMRVAAWRAFRRTWTWDRRAFDELNAEWKGLGAPTMFICRTAVQQLFVEDMGVENGTYAVMDWEAARDEYFDALEVTFDRLIDVINASPINVINFGDNIHSSTLSPEWFVRFLMPRYQKRCEKLHRAGKFVSSHWDGNVKPLLPYARECGLDGIEAITPLPQGDVTLKEVRAALGDMFLLDGIPAVYFNDTYPLETLTDCAKECIDLFAPRLILGASDEVSSEGNIERVRAVTRVVDDYNASL